MVAEVKQMQAFCTYRDSFDIQRLIDSASGPFSFRLQRSATDVYFRCTVGWSVWSKSLEWNNTVQE